MNTEQAYINGFVKRASEYGFSQNEAISLLKQAAPGLVTGGTGAAALKTMPKVNPATQNEKIMQPGQKAFNQNPITGKPLTLAELAKAND